MDSSDRKEAERVHGTWFKYFEKTIDMWFDDEVCRRYEVLLDRMYGDFFDRNLSTEGGPLLELGVGFGLSCIPLARKGYRIIGIDNDREVLDVLERNAEGYGLGKVEAQYGDLYTDFHTRYLGQEIQACVSFGVLEHFKRSDLEGLIKKQFVISPLMVCMMPVNTPSTLKSFKAEGNPEGHVDENGIYRNFWSPEFWENEVFGEYSVIDRCFPVNQASFGRIEMVTFAVREKQTLIG